MPHTVLVLGGGVGGLIAAHRLRRRLPKTDKVILVDRDTEYWYAPSYLWVLDGSRAPGKLARPLARLRRHGIDVHCGEVTGIDTDKRQVDTAAGVLGYDRLVIGQDGERRTDGHTETASANASPTTRHGTAASSVSTRSSDWTRSPLS
jgi:sulfide:quinone oxidoreductase